ncbi:DUF2914 domain-containing protein [Psychromonas sp. 14N.309.X.WAT.B.A12]|uniref:DUF2914 domain-containing protein n=1 Tax=Psychromonas sp. 14N.309.X.WAT.B.A12 TaxID=2998322 RepID=UPI0025AF8662|nr:DUF2914 domain-containing protein [Psychromonas sp. 14N.309.X.WAT.B.A12]MDN2663147.1 DUF2914 domain-containing protein [Psychromonas sp. 14N.309.X.WAT.B.A12]
MKEPEDFTVRVNFRPHQNVVAPVEHSLHWGRIITCLLIVALIIAVIMMLAQQYFTEQSTTPLVNTDQLTNNTTTTSQANPVIDTSTIEQNQATNEIVALTVEPQVNQQSDNNNLVVDINEVNSLNTETTTFTDSNAYLVTDLKAEESTNTDLKDYLGNDGEADLETNSVNEVNNLALTNQALDSSTQETIDDTNFTDVGTHVSDLSVSGSTNSDFGTVEETQVSEIERNQPIATNNETSINEQHLFAEHITLPPSTLLIQGSVQRLSDNINRFQITPMVEDHEPLGTINDIEVENGTLTVYAFSEVYNLKDTVLYYVWNLNGKDVATVPITIGADRWRSHSTKFIGPSMKGQWAVKLQNAQGDTLAVNEFTYEP